MKSLFSVIIIIYFANLQAIALPPPEDIPEEILRTEIILEGRSPIDGKALNAEEYAQLKEDLTKPESPLPISPKIRELIYLLQIRDLFKTITPF